MILGLILGVQGWFAYQSPEIVIEWETASELDTVGYNLFRSQAQEDPGAKINPDLIPASVDPLSGKEYSYLDTQVEADQVYYYWLEDVNQLGSTNRHGPIVVEAKRDVGALLQTIMGGGICAVLLLGWLWKLTRKPAA